MQIKLDFGKTLEQNAEEYFEKAKKLRKKLAGAKKAIELSKQRLAAGEERKKQSEERKAKESKEIVETKKEWFEKFRWFVSSDGFLVIGGRDATTNDIVVKKHLSPKDIVFHTELPGSPFAVVKADSNDNKEIPEQTLQEAAEFCATFSRAWKQGLTTTDVYSVSPEQIKHELGLPKGTFMIYGNRRYFKPVISLALGMFKNKIMAGPVSAVKKNCEVFIELKNGEKKPSDVAKVVRKKTDAGLDDIIRALPAGGFSLLKPK